MQAAFGKERMHDLVSFDLFTVSIHVVQVTLYFAFYHDLARCPVAIAVAVVQTIVICFVAFDDRLIGT